LKTVDGKTEVIPLANAERSANASNKCRQGTWLTRSSAPHPTQKG